MVPADLRVDHVWLISCKYLSKVLANAAPARSSSAAWPAGPPPARPATGTPRSRPTPTRRCSPSSARELGTRASLPPHAADLTPGAPRRAARLPRRRLVTRGAGAPTARSPLEVGKASADRWRRALAKRTEAEAVLWRLLRIGSAPYFVLGAQRDRSLRLRVMTPWDWRQAYELKRMDVWGDDAGQPQVRWQALVREQGHRRGAHRRRPRRGPLEPRPLRQAPRGQGLPRHPPPPSPRLRHLALSRRTQPALGDGLHALEGLAHAVAELVVVVVLAAEEELGEDLATIGRFL